MQKFPKVMDALGFSADESSRNVNKLSDGIDGLPTKLDDVVATAQRMTSVTGNLDKSTDATLALNNAMLASGASTDDASRGMEQYIQMLSTGKVDMQSWRTLQETMPIGLQKTAEAMGFLGRTAQVDLYAP
ncbi:tape measure protein [Enterococcus termitis]